MIPPIPDSKFFEKLTEEQDAAFKQLQDGYEAEVKVYRCFEELQRDVIVIHQLEYTNEQYSAFVPDHKFNKKSKSNKHGETDFVAIGGNFVAVFEVKGLNDLKINFRDNFHACYSKFTSMCCLRRHQREISKREENNLKLKGCCEDAVRQRNRIVHLVQHLDSSAPVFQFTIFPNISKREVDKRYLADETLLFGEDMDTFSSWFDTNLPQIPVDKEPDCDMLSIKRCLLGLWCINQDNKWDVNKCSLIKCILDVDEKVKKALVTQRAMDDFKHENNSKKGQRKRKDYPENKEMVPAPDIFRKYLNIHCLTKSQIDLFDSEEKLVWADGNVTMLGKIIHLALNTPEEERILLLMIGSDKTPAVHKNFQILNNIGEEIDCEMVIHKTESCPSGAEPSSEYIDSVYNKIPNSNSKIVIVVIERRSEWPIPQTLTGLFSYVFVDDYQSFSDHIFLGCSEAFPNSRCLSTMAWYLLYGIRRSSASASLWIFCDDGQSNHNANESSSNERENSFRSLSVSLSKTYDCAIMGLPRINGEMVAWSTFDRDGKTLVHISRSILFTPMKLTVNLRNTYEISTVLSIIRGYHDEVSVRLKVLNNEGQKKKSKVTTLTHRLIPQTGGHFLRGSKPVIYLIKGNNENVIEKVLEKELQLLKRPGNSFGDKDIVVIHDHFEHYFVAKLLGKWKFVGCLALRDLYDCVSAEWPAMVFVHKHSHFNIYTSGDWRSCSQTIPQIYSALSRARVYCSIIIHSYRPNNCDYLEELITELRKNTDVCRVVDVVDSGLTSGPADPAIGEGGGKIGLKCGTFFAKLTKVCARK